MKAKYMIENPQEIEATLKITMTVREWETLSSQLCGKWPSSRLCSAITTVLADARRHIYAPEDDAFNPRSK